MGPNWWNKGYNTLEYISATVLCFRNGLKYGSNLIMIHTNTDLTPMCKITHKTSMTIAMIIQKCFIRLHLQMHDMISGEHCAANHTTLTILCLCILLNETCWHVETTAIILRTVWCDWSVTGYVFVFHTSCGICTYNQYRILTSNRLDSPHKGQQCAASMFPL